MVTLYLAERETAVEVVVTDNHPKTNSLYSSRKPHFLKFQGRDLLEVKSAFILSIQFRQADFLLVYFWYYSFERRKFIKIDVDVDVVVGMFSTKR